MFHLGTAYRLDGLQDNNNVKGIHPVELNLRHKIYLQGMVGSHLVRRKDYMIQRNNHEVRQIQQGNKFLAYNYIH